MTLKPFHLSTIFAVGLAALTAAGVGSMLHAYEDAHSTTAEAENETGVNRQREGTQIKDQEGYFRTTGDGLIFHLRESEERYAALENLALERIGKVMNDRHDHPEQLTWIVSGFFTEYRGSNFLFITHAVLENKNRRRGGAR